MGDPGRIFGAGCRELKAEPPRQ